MKTKVLLTRQERLDRVNAYYPTLADIQLLRVRERYIAGAGSLTPKVMFIGDVPGQAEAQCGQALAGTRRNVVQSLLKGIDLKLEHIYTTHILKYRTQNGRDPKDIELEVSMPSLLNEIDILKPDVIVTWGRFALNAFAEGQRLQDVHGKHILSDHGLMIVPMFSPDAAHVNRNVAEMVIRDFQTIRNLV